MMNIGNIDEAGLKRIFSLADSYESSFDSGNTGLYPAIHKSLEQEFLKLLGCEEECLTVSSVLDEKSSEIGFLISYSDPIMRKAEIEFQLSYVLRCLQGRTCGPGWGWRNSRTIDYHALTWLFRVKNTSKSPHSVRIPIDFFGTTSEYPRQSITGFWNYIQIMRVINAGQG